MAGYPALAGTRTSCSRTNASLSNLKRIARPHPVECNNGCTRVASLPTCTRAPLCKYVTAIVKEWSVAAAVDLEPLSLFPYKTGHSNRPDRGPPIRRILTWVWSSNSLTVPDLHRAQRHVRPVQAGARLAARPLPRGACGESKLLSRRVSVGCRSPRWIRTWRCL